MKVIYNSLIPWSGFYAINLFGVLFVRDKFKKPISRATLNHERIHTSQMKELLYLGFYLIYFFEWIFRLFLPGDAYKNISFEKEAYKNERNPDYLKTRKIFGMWRR